MWQIIRKENYEEVAAMERFVKAHPNGHFLQCPQWADVKIRWTWRGILLYRDRQLVGALSLLIRPMPFGFSLLYAPRGPVCDRNDLPLMEELMAAVREIAGVHHAVTLYMDPDEPDSNQNFRSIMSQLGFQEQTDEGFGNIQPQYVFRLPLKGNPEETIFSAFHPRTRYKIRLAQRKGVTIREYPGDANIPDAVLDSFSAMMEATGQRDHFRVRNKAYFEGLLKALKGEACLFIADFQGEPIAGAIEVFCGNKAWYLYGASSNNHREAMPNYLLQWTMIRRAIHRGCELYDFRGVPGCPAKDGPLYGLYRFKKGFSGTYTKFTGMFVYHFSPVLGRILAKLAQHRRSDRHSSNSIFKKCGKILNLPAFCARINCHVMHNSK